MLVDSYVFMCLTFIMNDKYFLKKEKVANLLFDLVKYLLTALGAAVLFGKEFSDIKVLLLTLVIAIITFSLGVIITPIKGG
jgi:hypothetical protein